MMFVDALIGVLAPHQCLMCRREGAVLCLNCTQSAGEPLPSRCAGCKKLTTDNRTCIQCKRWMPVNRVFVATEYIDVYEDLVHAYKFDVRRQAAEPIATIMSRIKVDNAVLLWPLPTASARIRERGFDHTKLLTRQLRKITGQSFTAALKRRSNTRQLGATRTQRMRKLQDEFFVEDASPVKGAHYQPRKSEN